jgi:hypothetical protein
MTQEQMMELIANMAKEIESLKAEQPAVAKNHTTGKVTTTKYVRLKEVMDNFGNVPQQQKDLAQILTFMEVGKEYTEAEVFAVLQDKRASFNSLASAKQDVTYLFRYYRGLKNDGKYAGFIARNYLRAIK